MDKLMAVFIGVVMLALVSVFSGTLIWLLWPTAVTAFPALVAKGYLIAEITWPSAICLSYVCGILFKATTSSSTSSSD